MSNGQTANEPFHFIERIECSSVLSFSTTESFCLERLKKINIFIGENSSGKSNIIRAITGFTPDHNGEYPLLILFKDGCSVERCPLNKIGEEKYPEYKGKYSFFAIPPFRNLRVSQNPSQCEGHECSGMIDVSKIDSQLAFYSDLERIIGITGLSLTPSDEDLSLANWTRYGKYDRIIGNDLKKDIDIDLLGWGTKSIIILYYNLFFYPNSIVFIEEPEISTHPKLLKNLFEWAFNNRPDCQFFITTHSSLLLDKVFLGQDSKDVQIFQVYKEGTFTKASLLNDAISNIKVIEQLGFQASNLLFTNYVIWVEGPSDIFYYEAFLNMASFLCSGSVNIRRGIHYEIMWYGGSVEGQLIDIEPEKELSILFSFTRRGAIFWDYDKDYDRGSDKQAPKDTHKKILEYSNREDLEGRFIVGCTGEILKDNIYSGNDLPLAIENLIPKAICGEFVQSKPKRNSEDKSKLLAIFEHLSQNKKLTKEEKSTFNRHKINLSRAFLKKVNELIKETRTNEIEEILLGPPFDDIKATFFGELLKEIKKANE